MTKPNLQGQGGQRAAWIGLQVESHRKGDFAWICACPRCVGLKWRGITGMPVNANPQADRQLSFSPAWADGAWAVARLVATRAGLASFP